jgi:hypothetical protein
MWTVLGALAVALPARTALAAPKNDFLVMENGDRLCVDIKGLEHGRLTAKTGGMGTVTVHWGDAVTIESTRTFEVEAASGVRYSWRSCER